MLWYEHTNCDRIQFYCLNMLSKRRHWNNDNMPIYHARKSSQYCFVGIYILNVHESKWYESEMSNF